jgi:hypothetical protein
MSLLHILYHPHLLKPHLPQDMLKILSSVKYRMFNLKVDLF